MSGLLKKEGLRFVLHIYIYIFLKSSREQGSDFHLHPLDGKEPVCDRSFSVEKWHYLPLFDILCAISPSYTRLHVSIPLIGKLKTHSIPDALLANALEINLKVISLHWIRSSLTTLVQQTRVKKLTSKLCTLTRAWVCVWKPFKWDFDKLQGDHVCELRPPFMFCSDVKLGRYMMHTYYAI